MTYFGTLASIAAVFLLACLSPGPSFVVISSTAIAVSRRAGILLGLGVAGSTLTWATATMLGLGLLLAQVAWLYQVIRLAGAAYLVWIGLAMLLASRRPSRTETIAMPPLPPGRYVLRGYLLSVANPTAVAFFGSIFAVMLPQDSPAWLGAAAVALVTLLSGLWHCGISLIFSIRSVQLAYRRLKTGLDVAIGSLLVLLGLRLALSR